MDNLKILYQSNYFSVIEKTIEIKGKTFKRDFIKRNPVVIIVALSSNNEIYLAQQYRMALERQSLELIAGTLEEGEDSLSGAKRELEEEAGITAQQWKHLTTMQLSANMDSKIDVFLAKDIKEEKTNQDEDEDITVIKLPLKEAINKALTGEINITAHIAVILLLDKLQIDGKI